MPHASIRKEHLNMISEHLLFCWRMRYLAYLYDITESITGISRSPGIFHPQPIVIYAYAGKNVEEKYLKACEYRRKYDQYTNQSEHFPEPSYRNGSH